MWSHRMFPRNVGLLLVAVALCFGAVTLRGPPEFSLMAKALDGSENYVDAKRALNDPAGTDLSTRSPGTVDTLLRERFLGLIFSLVSSTLFWQGLGVATTMWAAGCTIAGAASVLPKGGKIACAVGTALGALGTLGGFLAARAAAQAAATETLEWVGMSFLDLDKRDEKVANISSLDPHLQQILRSYQRHRFHHSHNGSLVTHDQIMNATEENPLYAYGAGTHMMPWNYTLFAQFNSQTNNSVLVSKFAHPGGQVSQKKRQEYCFTINEAGETACEGDPNPGDPSDWYLGVDAYGSSGDLTSFDEAMGSEDDGSLLIQDTAINLGNTMVNGPEWEGCLCGQQNGNWIFTGSLQATWNYGPYNGYSPCWNPGCDGA